MSDPTPDRVRIFDTTLRDGEQSPGCSMTRAQKVAMARALAELGVDTLEAGFAAASPDDFAAIQDIAASVRGSGVAALARCQRHDIERAAAALEAAEAPRIHVFIATSDLHLAAKLRMTRAEALEAAGAAVELARRYVDDVEFSAEDASRSDPEYLAEVFSAAIEAGASTLNAPDTVGYAVPAEYAALFAHLLANVPGVERAVLSCHCHDDLGLAVANSLAAIENGARQVECTVNGIGERAGNAALEEIVMGLRTRAAHYGVVTRIRTERLYPVSRRLVALTGSAVARNKAIIGENAFAHESGIHQHGLLRNRATYEIMAPEDVGVSRSQLVLGKHSGRAALADRLQALGIVLDEAALNQAFARFKALADRKKEVFDADLEAIALGATGSEQGPWRLVALQAQGAIGREAVPSASVRLAHGDGRTVQEAAVGDGPVHAIFAAIERATGTPITLREYHLRSLSTGEDAQGEARVDVTCDGREYCGRAASTDVLEASALALVEVINRIERRRTLESPESGLVTAGSQA
ncbi:MAG TPA: 2-isopropylmalate synthase [Woeseiaceae bacterium]|nr:2-isopropylmalate synthase [Woeseiaceae bacterium]